MSPLVLRVAALFFAAVGLEQAANAGYIHAKAALAQVLIREAWIEAGRTGGAPKPWPWADTTPVARLMVPTHGVDLIVLEGGSGRTLAFGPGHVTGTALPGRRGNAVIGGHRDTHFRFLKDVESGERIAIETVDGTIAEYVVTNTRVVDHREVEVQRDFGDDRLTLITCFPFDAVQPGGPQRYVVTAIRERHTETVADPDDRWTAWGAKEQVPCFGCQGTPQVALSRPTTSSMIALNWAAHSRDPAAPVRTKSGRPDGIDPNHCP